MSTSYIVAAVRTPNGRFGGSLRDLSPVVLGAHVMQAALQRAAVDAGDLDLYIFGNVLKHGHGQLLPRHAALRAGIPPEVDGYAIDMLCSSGMQSVINADMAIRAGDADLVLAGGIESMSQAGFHLSSRARWGYKLLLGDAREPLTDELLVDGLTDPMTGELMGEESDRLAHERGVTREELDEVALLSNQRAAAATAAGKFGAEIAPIEILQRKRSIRLERDEGIRAETTRESLAALHPAFGADGLLTAGNSSQISDGAAALLLASERAVKERGLKPLARVMGSSWAALESWRFVEAPVPAIERLGGRLGMRAQDFDLVENNEAFALNSVLLRRALGIPYERMNIYGGAIALGHPIGASGARILVTLVHALGQEKGHFGLAALCHGTGGATAVALERV
jgi:acetyl-CoA C-acetyltransferase